MSAVATEPDLPPPACGLFLEVSFRRLLASCEGVVNGATGNDDTMTTSMTTIRPELARNWATSPVFHHVSVTRVMLSFTESTESACRSSSGVIVDGGGNGNPLFNVVVAIFFPLLSLNTEKNQKNQQYVETLQEQLADLEGAAPAKR